MLQCNGLKNMTSPECRLALYKLCFHYASRPATGLDLSHKNEGKIRKRNYFPWSPSPHNGGTTGITVDTVHCKRKQTPLMEEAKKAKRKNDRTEVNPSERTGIHSLESAGVMSKPVPPSVCVIFIAIHL